MKHFLRSEFLNVFLIICVTVLIGVFPTLYHLSKTPPGTQFSYAFNFYSDYYHYLSWIRDGQNGYWDITTRFTSEVFARRYAYPLYPLLGHLGAILKINATNMYFLARIFFACLRLLLIYMLIRILIPQKIKRIAAFIVTIYLPSFLKVYLSDGKLAADFFLNGITNFDVFLKIAFIPHHVLAHIFVMFCFVLFFKALKENKKIYSLFCGILLLIASILNPAAILYMFFVLSVAFGLLWFNNYRGNVKELLAHFLPVAVGVLLALAYYKFYLFTVYPWDNLSSDPDGSARFTSWVNNSWTFLDYLGALGPALPLTLVALWLVKIKKNIIYILLLSWGIGPVIAFLGFNNFFNRRQIIFRLFQSQQDVPLGILASLAVFALLAKFKNKIVRAGMIIILLTVSLPYYYLTYKSQFTRVSPAYYNVYLPVETIQAFEFLNRHTPSESVVLAGFYLGQMLPAYTNNRVYLGSSDMTYAYEKKLVLFTKFFNNQMTGAQAKEFFKTGKISYIFFGPDTGAPQELASLLGSVKLIYQNGNNYIYQVVP